MEAPFVVPFPMTSLLQCDMGVLRWHTWYVEDVADIRRPTRYPFSGNMEHILSAEGH